MLQVVNTELSVGVRGGSVRLKRIRSVEQALRNAANGHGHDFPEKEPLIGSAQHMLGGVVNVGVIGG